MKDPFYLTKLLIGIVGKHAGALALRLAIYLFVVFPFLTMYVGLSSAEAGIVVLLLIVAYYSAMGIIDRLKSEVKNGSS